MRRGVHAASSILVLISLLAACGSETDRTVGSVVDETTPSTSTSSLPAASTTLEATTTSTDRVPTTSTTVVSKVGFDPECSEVEPSRPLVESDEAALDVFGPIGSEPSVEIQLPKGWSEMTGELTSTSAVSHGIPGGVLIRIAAGSGGYFPGGMLAAVDHDGTLRWLRCFDDALGGLVVASAVLGPTSALVEVRHPTADDPYHYEWDVLSVADGTITGSLDDLIRSSGIDPVTAATTPIAIGGGSTILGLDGDQAINVESDRLLRMDLVTMTAVELPYPPGVDGQRFLGQDLALLLHEQVFHMTTSDIGLRVPLAVEIDGVWVTDPATLREVWGATAGYFYSGVDLPALVAYDATGRELWRRDDVRARVGEGFIAEVVGDVVMARSCVLTDDEVQPCEQGALGGYSMVDGHTLYQLDGWRTATVIGDGLAIVSVPSGAGAGVWMMIDTTTGEIVSSDQQWDDPAAFDSQCCAGDEFFNVTRSGGVLVVHSGEFVRVWHPRDLAHPTVSITLP